MKKAQLKCLAEDHYFGGKVLTEEEYDILKESEYAHLVTKKDTFDCLFEEANPLLQQPVKLTPIKKPDHHKFHTGPDRNVINHLVNEIEHFFHLGISNTSTRKYMKTDVFKLRDFIRRHVEDDMLRGDTAEYLLSVANNPKYDVYDIMSDLYLIGQL
jgi:hypothetical protein